MDGQERYQGSNHPHQHNHNASSTLCQHRLVAQGRRDGQITVYSYDTKGLNACSHTEHIGGSPKVTPETTKVPSLKDVVTGTKRNHNETHDQVGAGQGCDETVGDILETLEAGNCYYDQDVTKDNAKDEQGHDHAQQDHCCLTETLLLLSLV